MSYKVGDNVWFCQKYTSKCGVVMQTDMFEGSYLIKCNEARYLEDEERMFDNKSDCDVFVQNEINNKFRKMYIEHLSSLPDLLVYLIDKDVSHCDDVEKAAIFASASKYAGIDMSVYYDLSKEKQKEGKIA